MAIRKPSVYKQNHFVFQDFSYCEDEVSESRYILAKYDGEAFETVGQTFDYPTPDLKGGYQVARIDYTIEGALVTVDHWEVNWRDEWPLRLAFQFLANCLYSQWQGYTIRIGKDSYAFWISERFTPISNEPDGFLLKLD